MCVLACILRIASLARAAALLISHLLDFVGMGGVHASQRVVFFMELVGSSIVNLPIWFIASSACECLVRCVMLGFCHCWVGWWHCVCVCNAMVAVVNLPAISLYSRFGIMLVYNVWGLCRCHLVCRWQRSCR